MLSSKIRTLFCKISTHVNYQTLCQRCSSNFESLYSLKQIYPNSKNDPFAVPEVKSTYSTEIEEAFSGYIPIDKLDIKYMKSGGPGGQNVNKVNTKVEIRFHVDDATWIPEWIKPRLKTRENGRINKEGELIINSDKTRTQILNQADCLDRIRTMIFQAGVKPKEMSEEEKLKHQKDFARSNSKRLEGKRRRSSIKRLRRSTDD